MEAAEKIEIDLFLQAVYQKYGYDFRNYSKSSIRRRVLRGLSHCGMKTVSEMTHAVLYDKTVFEDLLTLLTVNVSEMFRDPSFFRALKQNVFPLLADQPYFKIWHAGCSTGEEVYSMAIMLKEAGLLGQAGIYATDSDEAVLDKAKEGVFSLNRMKGFTKNYLEAGGEASFADYYQANYDYALMDKSLKEKIVFANHNLVTDSTFAEVDLIICRNVIIYFDQQLQARVFKLFSESLNQDGFLCLGSKESLRFSAVANDFEDVVKEEKIYKKITAV